jgi:hypothetical protein
MGAAPPHGYVQGLGPAKSSNTAGGGGSHFSTHYTLLTCTQTRGSSGQRMGAKSVPHTGLRAMVPTTAHGGRVRGRGHTSDTTMHSDVGVGGVGTETLQHQRSGPSPCTRTTEERRRCLCWEAPLRPGTLCGRRILRLDLGQSPGVSGLGNMVGAGRGGSINHPGAATGTVAGTLQRAVQQRALHRVVQ